MISVRHKQTGYKYILLSENAQDESCGEPENLHAVYVDKDSQYYVREINEFWRKFEKVR